MARPPRPGRGGNYYDRTRKLELTPQERALGWSIEICINCEQGKRRRMSTCELCGGVGKIKTFNGDAFTEGKPGRPRRRRRAA